MAYMGDVSTRQSMTFHIYQILSAGIKYSQLRDEIYCQICKQTTKNPSRLSNMKGWQAMAICCGFFLPSENFMPYLVGHLQQVAGGNVTRQGTVDLLGQSSFGMANSSEAAAYSLARLRKLIKTGPRHFLPLKRELEAIELMEGLSGEVVLPDGSWQAYLFQPTDTSEEVVGQLVNILGLLEARYYGLFQMEPNGVSVPQFELYYLLTALYLYGWLVEKLIAANAYIMEVETSCSPLSSTPQSIKDIRFKARAMSKLLCGLIDENVLPAVGTVILGNSEGKSQFSESKLKLLLKRKLYLVDLASLPEDMRSAVLAFEYSQAVHDVVHGVQRLSEADAMLLGAMQLRADLGTSQVSAEMLAGLDGSKYGPPYCIQGNEGAWKDAIAMTLAALPHEENTTNWKQDYVDYVKSRCPLYEACRFFVKPLSNPSMPSEIYLAVSATGVYFVDVGSRESLVSLEFPEIASWGYTPTAFSIVTGSMTFSHDHQFQTNQGLEIANTLQMYVDFLQGIQQKSESAPTEGSMWGQNFQAIDDMMQSLRQEPPQGSVDF